MAEASLMELPVVSTRSGSIDEVVVDGKTGVLIEPGNQNELEEAMVRLATDERLRENMGEAGRQHIVDNFSHQVVANKFYVFFSRFIRNY
jgi:glycosyltransferase involved in cell wall biosynthesis